MTASVATTFAAFLSVPDIDLSDLANALEKASSPMIFRAFVPVFSRGVPVFSRELSVFSRGVVVAPQLWGSCTTIVGQLHHSCEAIAPQLWGNGNLGDKNKKLACRNKSKADNHSNHL